jgi:hypothetical protein
MGNATRMIPSGVTLIRNPTSVGASCKASHVPLLVPVVSFEFSIPTLCCRRRGGLEEERAERQRWNEKEQNKIMDSVRGE